MPPADVRELLARLDAAHCAGDPAPWLYLTSETRAVIEAVAAGGSWQIWIEAGGGWRAGFKKWRAELDAALAAWVAKAEEVLRG